MKNTNAQSIVGSGNNRSDNDFYPTPEWATEALFAKEHFIGDVWECAAGDGSMARVIEKHNFCHSTDIIEGIDFFSSIEKSDNIITNPPYKYALEFINHAKELADKKIAMLLKLAFLEGQNRYDFFQDEDFPLKSVYVFFKRLNFFPVKTGAGMIAFAWYVWDKDYTGKPSIDWIL